MPKKKKLTVVQQHQANYETLLRAVHDGNISLLDCVEKSTGEHVAVLCAIGTDQESNEPILVPFAKFFNDNPYELLEPPVSLSNSVSN